MFNTYSCGGHNNQLCHYEISFVDTDNTCLFCTRQIITCEPIDIIWHSVILFILLLELVILNLNVKNVIQNLGIPSVLYCTIYVTPLKELYEALLGSPLKGI